MGRGRSSQLLRDALGVVWGVVGWVVDVLVDLSVGANAAPPSCGHRLLGVRIACVGR